MPSIPRICRALTQFIGAADHQRLPDNPSDRVYGITENLRLLHNHLAAVDLQCLWATGMNSILTKMTAFT